jgi:PIN domain nuclease of toxin-antitoxin system
VLLDTHVWIWAAESSARLGAATRRRLMRANRQGEPVAVSATSVFEVVALHTAGRLRLTIPVERWIHESIERGRLRVLEIDRETAIGAGMIPNTSLGGPIGRCLVATSREHGLPLVTADRRVLDYAAQSALVTAIDAGK